ncbi:MAG: GNAT family N-acetyltransferase, partial [Candidatus Brocadiae bacterium]|nr:GNAT family N-acetyltransferase [Candidatus Brocadiia bacterium]
MEIRPGRPEEADTMVEFQLKMAKETEGIRLDRATVAAGVRAVFADPRKGRYWVAEEDGQVAASLLVTPEWSDWGNATVWWIQSLYVREAHRRQGVFRMMFEHLRRLVEADDGLLGLRLYVAANNAAAQRAYEAVGMDCRRYRT